MPNSKFARNQIVSAKQIYLNRTKITATSDELNALAGSGIVLADATKLHAVTAAAATINQVAAAAGTVTFDRSVKIALVPLVGTTIHAATMGWTNPEAGDILISRVMVDVTTVAGQAGTLSVGTTTVALTTTSANLLDTLDVRTATGIFDNVTDKGSAGKSRQRLATGKFVTFGQASGDTSSMIANAYIFYHNA